MLEKKEHGVIQHEANDPSVVVSYHMCGASKIWLTKIISFQIDGVNLQQIPAKDMCAYGRALLDFLFTKHEQASSVIIRTPKSNKPPLDIGKVQKLFGKTFCISRAC